MKIANKALWLIESRLREVLTLEAVAQELKVSPYHLARAFSLTFGISFMRYVRRRRLVTAAASLVETDQRIIEIALDAGYGSQEAFTRAFVAETGMTPQGYRQRGTAPAANLEARLMKSDIKLKLQPPVIEDHPAIRLVGLSKRYNAETSARIPDQWASFNELDLQVPANASAFGVCHNGDTEGNLDYFCGLSVPDFEGIGATNDRLTVPAQRYAKFRHEGHISEMQDFWAAIFNDGLPQSGVEKTEGADLEYYGPEFDPMSGEGGYEVWIAVK
ncbi:MAG: AraC family transcriptional regulator [Pseudomonadales bacterium]|nr:AraC family transcriptional regulator [Pseudomonadales bacterium]